MYKLLSSLVGIMLAGATIGYAATIGTPPTPATGPGLTDGTWLNGLAGGNNVLAIFGITVTGSTSTTSLQLTPGFRLYQLDTAPTSNGAVNLPVCSAGADVTIINNTSNTIFVFPSTLVNTLTATQDTLDGNKATGAINIVTTSTAEFYCAKNGSWFH